MLPGHLLWGGAPFPPGPYPLVEDNKHMGPGKAEESRGRLKDQTQKFVSARCGAQETLIPSGRKQPRTPASHWYT